MTQKELLYLEDAIGHESSIITILDDSINSIEDNKLKAFLEKEYKSHEKMKQRLMNLLEAKANE